MAQNNSSDGPPADRPPSSADANATGLPQRLTLLHMVVGWRSISVLTALSVLAAALLGMTAWPFWDREPRVITVSKPAPKIAESDLAAGKQDVDRLTRRIAELEKAVADKRSACVIPQPPPQPPAKIDRPPPKQSELNCEETCRLCNANRRELRGNVSISLAWDSYADLDLYLVCPDGHQIRYNNRGACGGELNVDMNVSSNKSTTPIENITLTEQAPTGKYRILVHFYAGQPLELNVPYRVTLNLRGQSQTFTGTAVWPDNKTQMILVHEFEIEPDTAPASEGGVSFQLKCEECNCNQRRTRNQTPLPGDNTFSRAAIGEGRPCRRVKLG